MSTINLTVETFEETVMADGITLDLDLRNLPAEQQASVMMEANQDYISPTLSDLEQTRRPQPRTACDQCPNAVWFSTKEEVRCYCRVMFLVSWDSKKPSEITS